MSRMRTARIRAVVVALAALLLSAVPVVAGAGSASAVVFPRVQIWGQWHGSCLDGDVSTAGRDPQTAQMWRCNLRDQQAWTLIQVGDSDRWIMQNVYSKKCLDADVNNWNTDGARVQLWTCNLSQQQQWRWAAPNFVAANGKCLDADRNALRDGARVQVWRCNGSDQQIWDLTAG